MSGSMPEAESGQLVVLAGGEAEDIGAARPILGTAALAEDLRHGTAAGLDRTVLIETFQDRVLVSEHHRHKLEMAKDNHYPSQFPTRLVAKDMGQHADNDYAAAIQAMEDLGSR